MTVQAQITMNNGEVWLCPVTLKVCMDWERWTGKPLSAMAEPYASDFAYLCWRAAFYAGKISKRLSLDQFAIDVAGWEILNIEPNGIDQLEEWLKEQ